MILIFAGTYVCVSKRETQNFLRHLKYSILLKGLFLWLHCNITRCDEVATWSREALVLATEQRNSKDTRQAHCNCPGGCNLQITFPHYTNCRCRGG
jgi:hypothetical protein